MQSLFERAQAFMSEAPGLEGGFVVFHDDELTGWVKELDRPCAWLPGSIAIDEAAKQYQATGGNSYDGAEKWEQISV